MHIIVTVADIALAVLSAAIAFTLMCTSLSQHCHYHCCTSTVTTTAVPALSLLLLSQRCHCQHCNITVSVITVTTLCSFTLSQCCACTSVRCLIAVGFLLCRRKNVFASYLPEWQTCAICSDTLVFTNVINRLVLILDCMNIFVACVADNCKHPCTQSAQRLQFACSNFH